MDIEREVDRSATKLAIIAKFIVRLGDPRQWEFTGEVLDGGAGSKAECICGHPIRWIFPIQRTNPADSAHVGSECINHFQEYNPDMCQAMHAAHERLLEQQKADKAAIKLAQEQAEQLPVYAKYLEVRHLGNLVYKLAKEHFDSRNRGWLDTPSYTLGCAVRQSKALKTVKGQTRWLASQTAFIEKALVEMEQFHAAFLREARERLLKKEGA